jgi:TusA-related sulfurtransferase/uncharacterized protein involved in tolerance to divalent cations
VKISLLNNIKIVFLSWIICFSCSTIKNVEEGGIIKVLHEKKLLDSVKSKEIIPEWIKIRGNSLISINEEENQEVEINIRSKIDSVIWVNITKYKKKIFRTLFTNDSVKMTIDYPEKLFFDGSIRELNDVTNLSFSYGLIQELIIGGSYLKYLDDKFILHVEDNEYHLLSHRPRKTKRITSSKTKKPVNYIYQSWINPFTFKCERINLIFPENSSQINIVYKNRQEINGYSTPMEIEIEVSNSETKYNIAINFKSIKYDIPQKLTFNKIDKYYKLLNFND